MAKTDKIMELAHYVVVYGALAVAWKPIMDYFKGDLNPTLIVGLLVFIIADQLAHKIILGEDFSLITG